LTIAEKMADENFKLKIETATFEIKPFGRESIFNVHGI
jgi:hypothetical protein